MGWQPWPLEAVPPAPPVTLSLRPSFVRPGDRIQITVSPQPTTGDPRGAPVFDLYVALGQENGSVLFLAAEGEWGPTPKPYLPARSLATLTTFTVSRLIDPTMAGRRFTVGVGFVEPGASPLGPTHWVYAPLTADVRVGLPMGTREWGITSGIAAALAIACLAAVIAVLRS